MNQHFLSTNQNEEFSERELLCFSGVIHSHEIIRTCVISLFSQFVGHIWNIDAWSVVSHRKCWPEFTKFQSVCVCVYNAILCWFLSLRSLKFQDVIRPFRSLKKFLMTVCAWCVLVSPQWAAQVLQHYKTSTTYRFSRWFWVERYNRRTTFQQKFQVDQLLRSLNYRRKP